MTVARVSMKIERTWCVDLGQEVTISEARREYLSLETPPKGFVFYCNDPACKDAPRRILVTGVRYREAAEESPKYKSAHFRKEHEHQPECRWIVGNNSAANPSEHEKDGRTRRALQKLTDLVTVFDPRLRPANSRPGTLSLPSTAINSNRLPQEATGTLGSSQNERHGETPTSDLDRLVDSYLEARTNLSDSEFGQLRLKIVGHGEVGYRDYFQQIAYTDSSGVIYGGTYPPTSFGFGFRLRFYDSHNNYPVLLYVSSEQLKQYKHGRYLRNTIDMAIKSKGKKYIRVFAIGRLAYSEEREAWDLLVDDLSHLSLILISKTPRVPTLPGSAPSIKK